MQLLTDLLTVRERGAGYFGGAEGAPRFEFFSLIAIIGATLFWIF